VKSTKKRVEEKKKAISYEKIIELAQKKSARDFPFEKALSTEDVAFICEIKKASPSKGVIVEDFPYIDIAREYEKAGVSAISVLTEPKYFKGSDRYLSEIVSKVSIPLLRKDFIVDSYMIYESKILGASAILLICSILNRDILSKYIAIASSLGLSALVETHNEDEIHIALEAGARIIGVNNRNLENFEVDVSLSLALRKLVPLNTLFVAESGIKSPEDIVKLRGAGVNAVLIGETVMRSSNKKLEISRLRGN
jgi:indole-3-glycerol phosphate synthase